MSKSSLSRPKTSVGTPLRSFSGDFGELRVTEDSASLSRASSALRLPYLSGARLSRQSLRWTEEPGVKRAVLGCGAVGKVFQAVLGCRSVAVKQVGGPSDTSRLSQLPGHSPDSECQRELRIAEVLLRLRHENVVRYLQFDTSRPGVLYVVMELIDGRNLAELRRVGPFSGAEMRSVIEQACCGLAYLHGHSPPIVHRDVKGANIMLSGRKVKLIDLGFAILCPECDRDQQAAASSAEQQQMTSRSLVGTYRFMAPEVYESFAYSAKSDVFALGCTAFELLCGQPPHADRSNTLAICYAVCHLPMPDLPAACDSRLAELYRACTLREPGMRPSAGEILDHSFIAGQLVPSHEP